MTDATASLDTTATDTVVLPPVAPVAPVRTATGVAKGAVAPATLEARAVSAWFGSHQVL
ncbi:hypothetical protein [Streptomyces sp. NPDC097610]|uniref:hypothetical protein n=1 Tax=Streptomyces sp. NPDC097610 TaxID=3157227 RepID=UPI00331AEB7F